MHDLIATHAVVLPGEAPEWIHLMPVGTVTGKDGRGPYRLPFERLERIVAASIAPAGSAGLPIDYDHQIHFTRENGGTAPAAGWIKKLEARADGIWGQVEWTQRAAQMLQAKEYRFVSPVFTHDKDGSVTKLLHAGLTNDPNFTLTALASRSALRDDGATPNKESGMDEFEKFLAELRDMFGLAKDADAAKVAAHARTVVDGHKQSNTSMVAIATAIGLQAGAKADDVVAKVKAVTENPDPAKYIGIASFNKLSADFAELQKQVAGKDVAAAVDKAISDGKLIPAQRDWATAYATSDLKAFQGYVAAAPRIVKPGATVAGGKPAGRDAELDADDLAVCAAMGVKPEDYKKNL